METVSSSPIKAQVQEATKVAMRAQDKTTLATCRLISAAFKQVEIDERVELDDAKVLAILDKMLKQREDSITQYQAIGRDELVAQEQQEITVIKSFMPTPLSDAEVEQLIVTAIEQAQAKTVQDMSKVMQILKPQVVGRADMGKIGARIKMLLG